MAYGAPTQTYEPGAMPVQSPRSSWRDFFLGSPTRTQQLALNDPEQAQALSMLLQRALGSVTGAQPGMGGQFDFAPIEQAARSQFEQQTIPSIAERFTALGGQGSSAFKQALGSAGAGLEQNLAAMKSQYNLQREPLMQNYLQMGLRPRFENMIIPGRTGFLENLLSGLISGGSQIGSAYLGGMGTTNMLSNLLGGR